MVPGHRFPVVATRIGSLQTTRVPAGGSLCGHRLGCRRLARVDPRFYKSRNSSIPRPVIRTVTGSTGARARGNGNGGNSKASGITAGPRPGHSELQARASSSCTWPKRSRSVTVCLSLYCLERQELSFKVNQQSAIGASANYPDKTPQAERSKLAV